MCNITICAFFSNSVCIELLQVKRQTALCKTISIIISLDIICNISQEKKINCLMSEGQKETHPQ